MTAEQLADEVLASRKYAHVDRATALSLCEDALRRYAKRQDAVKAVKRQLHIIHESFLIPGGFAKANALLEAFEGGAGDRALAADLLALHASTKERLPFMEAFYRFVSENTGQASSILDVGCGLHPFALPWMGVADGVRYRAFDISGHIAALLTLYFAKTGVANASAQTRSAILQPPEETADLAYVLKLLPVLEQQEKGAAALLLARLRARNIVVSFPTKSLSGRERGMGTNYAAFMQTIVPAHCDIASQLVVGHELVYILRNKEID